jgi:hypothetical protein
MRFRTFPGAEPDDTPVDDERADDARVHDWQMEQLQRLGYHSSAASLVLMAAWLHGEQADLVHRIERLVHRGASLDQAARIVVPMGSTTLAERPDAVV